MSGELDHVPAIIYRGAPEKIWLQLHGDASIGEIKHGGEPPLNEASWHSEPIFEHDIGYVREDRYKALQQVAIGFLSRSTFHPGVNPSVAKEYWEEARAKLLALAKEE